MLTIQSIKEIAGTQIKEWNITNVVIDREKYIIQINRTNSYPSFFIYLDRKRISKGRYNLRVNIHNQMEQMSIPITWLETKAEFLETIGLFLHKFIIPIAIGKKII